MAALLLLNENLNRKSEERNTRRNSKPPKNMQKNS
jgi:hypothetical protein